tara:strand:+ start:461 stop:682 length:222 start_codon:yes stop_codon:yes gene_type:complete
MSYRIIFIFLFFFKTKAYAYFALGPLIPILGNVLIYVVVLLFSVISIILYPIFKFRKKKRKIEKDTFNNNLNK